MATANAQTTTGVADDGTATDGQSLWVSKGCSGCHTVTSGGRGNAANAGAHITYANTQGMGGAALTTTERNNIAAYIAANNSTSLATQAVTFQGSKMFTAPEVSLNTSYGDYIGLRNSTNPPNKGTATYSGTTITYTASTGQCGTETFTYEAYRSGAAVQGSGTSSERSVTVDIADPAAPNISGTTGTRVGTVGVFASWTASNSGGASTTWDISSGTLPAGLSVSSTTGTISGTPTTAVTGGTNVTLRARNCLNGNTTGQSSTRVINITINKGTQAALTARMDGLSVPSATTYSNPNQTAALSTIGGSGGGAVTYSSSTTPSFCSVVGSTVTYIAGNGTCTVTATKASDANYNLATDTVSIVINKAPQSITFPVQTTATRSYVFGGTFLISPVATTSAAGLTVTYDSNTTGVCTHPGTSSTTVTMVSAGTCTIGANQAGNGNYNAAIETTRSVTINAILPQPPTIGAGVGGNAQAVINFTAPANTGGAAILDYTATCTDNAAVQPTRTATVASSPATVTATGSPTPTITMSGTLPSGVVFTGGAGTATLSGTAAGGTNGTYPLTFTASNGSAVMQAFTLTVQKASQTITAPALADRPMRPVPTSAAAGVSASSGLAVTYSITGGGNCGMVGSNIFTGGVSSCTVRTSQSGNASYNAATPVDRTFAITQGTQAINFGAQSGQTYSPAGMFTVDPKALPVDSIDLMTENGLAATHSSLTPLVCTISGIDITVQSAGICTIEATQAGNANYAAAPPVSQDIVIAQAAQTITWGAQASQSFGTGGTFAISPIATGGGSGNAIVYGSTTPSVCTVVGSTVTKLSAGTCTLTANQAGDDNYLDATQVNRNVTITASLATAPAITNSVATDSQVLLEFDPPSSNGGSAIDGYRATCNPGGITANGSDSPLLVTGLTNGVAYTCSVEAHNSAGFGSASTTVNVNPFLETGINTWTNVCSGCHGEFPAGVRFNAGGTTGTVINYVRSVQENMLGNTAVQALTLNELGEVAKYIETFVPAISANTAFNTPVNVDVSPHLTLGTVSFESAQVASNPANGTLGSFSGTQIQYTPNAGFVGMDT
ncbi:MAG: fibronectin type III domain-containing protein, partial [Betaproteobacteria bacterium]|nr:fibronectin type III domain-containing protein [Betaproteobacteria bacterium]